MDAVQLLCTVCAAAATNGFFIQAPHGPGNADKA
jgi:hypothetical protein